MGNERASWSTKAVLAKSSQFFHLAQRGFTGRTMLAPQGACSAGATYFGCKHWQVLHPFRELRSGSRGRENERRSSWQSSGVFNALKSGARDANSSARSAIMGLAVKAGLKNQRGGGQDSVLSSLGFRGALPVPPGLQRQDWGGFSPPTLKPGALSQIPHKKLFLPQKIQLSIWFFCSRRESGNVAFNHTGI